VLAAVMCALQAAVPETLLIRSIEHPPPPGVPADSTRYGLPQVRINTRQGSALVWLLRASDTVYVAAIIPDASVYWRDDFVLNIDTKGDGGPSPQHDDFQLDFHRVLDSSVVYRGRSGRWQPPRDDPDWRLGADRSGGGWEVSAHHHSKGWSLLVRLDPAWLAGEGGRLPRIAFRIYDDDPGGWFAWPLPTGTAPPTTVERAPALWAAVKR
jgi:hypothetical protein